MTEYLVTFYTKLSAKSEKDLERKAETIAEAITKTLKKRFEPHGYAEIEKKDKIKQTTLD